MVPGSNRTRRPRPVALIIGAAALLITWAPAQAAAQSGLAVTACGTVLDGVNGYLPEDLDCTGYGGVFVVQMCNSTFDFNGFSIIGGSVSHPVMACGGTCRCRFLGPGGLVDPPTVAIYSGARTSVEGVTISNAGSSAVSGGKLTIRDSTIIGCGAADAPAVVSSKKLKILDSVISGSKERGVVSSLSLVVANSTISGNGSSGIRNQGRGRIKDSHVDDNGADGIEGLPDVLGDNGHTKLVRSTVNGNAGHGIAHTKALSLKDSEVTGNALSGAWGPGSCSPQRTKLVRSVVAGNGLDADCGTILACADLDQCQEPVLKASVCEISHVEGSGIPGTSWGVCSLD